MWTRFLFLSVLGKRSNFSWKKYNWERGRKLKVTTKNLFFPVCRLSSDGTTIGVKRSNLDKISWLGCLYLPLPSVWLFKSLLTNVQSPNFRSFPNGNKTQRDGGSNAPSFVNTEGTQRKKTCSKSLNWYPLVLRTETINSKSVGMNTLFPYTGLHFISVSEKERGKKKFSPS